jgi:hypothetical protein
LHKGAVEAASENIARRAEGIERPAEITVDQTDERSALEIARQSTARSPFLDQNPTFDPIIPDMPMVILMVFNYLCCIVVVYLV